MYLCQKGKSLIEEHLSLCPLLPQYRVRIRLEATLMVQTFLFPIPSPICGPSACQAAVIPKGILFRPSKLQLLVESTVSPVIP